MKQLIAILSTALIPVLSFAKIGETKEYYNRYEHAPEMWYSIPEDPLLHNMQVRQIGHTGGMIGVGFDAHDRVAAEARWDTKNQIFNQLAIMTGTKQWLSNKSPSPALKKQGYKSYVSKDGRFVAYVGPAGENPFTGSFLYEIVVGTKEFIRNTETFIEQNKK